jgi:hypothetical protein
MNKRALTSWRDGAPYTLFLFLVLLLLTSCNKAAPADTAKMNERPGTAMAAFTAIRHSDTTETQNPYSVQVRQLAGSKATGGQIVYTVTNERGGKLAAGQVKLQHQNGEDAWSASIPAQTAGSTINYFYQLSTSDGQSVRHPARDPASYRFHVVPLQILSVEMPGGSAGSDQVVRLHLRAVSKPAGEMILRLLPSSPPGSNERRISLSSSESQGAKAGEFLMEGKVPDLQPGQIADFYFELRTSEGTQMRVPADAPARTYSIKRALRDVQSLPGDGAFVLDVGALERQRCVGLKGGGVWIGGIDQQPRRWGVGDGLLSGVARFVVPDSVTGHVYVGTDQGVSSIESNGNSWASVTAPFASAWAAELPSLKKLGAERRAGPGALSTLDGTLLFQVQREMALESAYPAAAFLQLQDDSLSVWELPSNIPLVGMSAMTFDSVEGCWLIGGFVPETDQQLRPVILRRTVDKIEQITLQDFSVRDLKATPTRVIALISDPSTGELLVALEFAVTNKSGRPTDYGVYRVDNASGKLLPLVEELAMFGTEITSLITDWQHAQVLVGTFGKGIWQVQSGAPPHQLYAGSLPAQITALKLDAESGAILIGSSRGAFELSADGPASLQVGPRGEGPRLTDALPMDQNQATGKVLLSSYSSGLFQLEREKSGCWKVAESFRPGAELPTGLFGDAQYTPSGGISAILYAQGLLLLENNRTTVLGTADGLRGNNLLRILVRHSGDVWVAHPPMPFGVTTTSAIQVIQSNRVARTFDVANRDLATIGRWIEMPERNSIFAATRAGVAEINKEGKITFLSTDSASSIGRDPRTGSIGVVGAAIQRWDGKRFAPVLFRVDHPRLPGEQFQHGSPIDIAIDKTGAWYLLYNGGVVVMLDSKGGFLNLLDAEDGIPPTAQKLLAAPETGDVFVGSSAEGLVVVLSPGGHT